VARRGGSSSRWLQRQHTDPYVKQREQQDLRSRAAYKLKEINDRDHLLVPGGRVLDLGASPGGWTEVAVAAVGRRGTVVAVDVLPMAPLAGATVITGDCREDAVVEAVGAAFDAAPVDLVMSDMAPNISGVAAVDEAAQSELAEMSLAYARRFLRPGGALLIKLFQFGDTRSLLQNIGQEYATVVRRKPGASRAESREFYVLARGYGI